MQQAIDILDEIVNTLVQDCPICNSKIGKKGCAEHSHMFYYFDKIRDKLQALGDGGGIFIVPGKTYYIGDNGIPAVALHPRFQYSNGTIDTIHHTDISELPPNK